MSDMSSPYAKIHSVGKSADPPPYQPPTSYTVVQVGERFHVMFGDRKVGGLFVSRFSAAQFAKDANATMAAPAGVVGED